MIDWNNWKCPMNKRWRKVQDEIIFGDSVNKRLLVARSEFIELFWKYMFIKNFWRYMFNFTLAVAGNLFFNYKFLNSDCYKY